MKKIKGAFLLSLAILVAFALTATSSQIIASALDVNPNELFVGLFAASFFVSYPQGIAAMAVTKEIWTKDVIENLFKNNQFASEAFNADQYVLNGKVVHIPIAGSPSAVGKNVSSFPVTALKRTDTDAYYNLDTFYTTPRQIEKIEQYELAYDKRQSVLGEDQKQIIQVAMDSLLFNWAYKVPLGQSGAAVANTIATTGAAQTEFLIGGGTGGRLKFTKDVFATIVQKMNIDNIPQEKRIALLCATHHQQLIDSFDVVAQTNFYRAADITKGVIGEYLGVKVMMRSSVLRMRKVSSIWTPVDEYADSFAGSTKTGDSNASLFYQGDCVERALGTVDIFDEPVRADYYGSVVSMILRMGGRQRRDKGVYVVVEDIAA